MNARIERAMNSKNFGARITKNGALDQKLRALEVIRGKMTISGCFGGHFQNFRVAGGSWCKR
jgi:hypothetical protein